MMTSRVVVMTSRGVVMTSRVVVMTSCGDVTTSRVVVMTSFDDVTRCCDDVVSMIFALQLLSAILPTTEL